MLDYTFVYDIDEVIAKASSSINVGKVIVVLITNGNAIAPRSTILIHATSNAKLTDIIFTAAGGIVFWHFMLPIYLASLTHSI